MKVRLENMKVVGISTTAKNTRCYSANIRFALSSNGLRHLINTPAICRTYINSIRTHANPMNLRIK